MEFRSSSAPDRESGRDEPEIEKKRKYHQRTVSSISGILPSSSNHQTSPACDALDASDTSDTNQRTGQTIQDLQFGNTHQNLPSGKSAQSCVAATLFHSVPRQHPFRCQEIYLVVRFLTLSSRQSSHDLHASKVNGHLQTSKSGQSSGTSNTSNSGRAGVASDTNQPARHATTDVSSMSEKLPGCKIPDNAQPTKMRSDCCRTLPLTDFRFRNRTAGTRMCQCRRCHTDRQREREQIKRARKAGWDIPKTASQIARSRSLTRSLWLLDQLVDAMRGPQKLIDYWRAECLKLARQKRSSTRLSRMYEMLIAMACQTTGMPWTD